MVVSCPFHPDWAVGRRVEDPLMTSTTDESSPDPLTYPGPTLKTSRSSGNFLTEEVWTPGKGCHSDDPRPMHDTQVRQVLRKDLIYS